MDRIRVGILGCADIVGWGLMDHMEMLPEIEVINIASRQRSKAEAFAARFKIPRTSTYEELLTDPDVDLIYIPLPNGLHAEWTIKSLRAGKAVLCEKPVAANAEEASRMAEVARETGVPLIEAVHYRYHPLARRLAQLRSSGALGPLRRIKAQCYIADDLLKPEDIRYRYDIAGGATMDPGCYTINVARLITGEEPAVRSARALRVHAEIDLEMEAQLEFPSGCIADLGMSLNGRAETEIRLKVEGEKGELDVTNFFIPHWGHEWTMRVGGETLKERFDPTPTFVFQMRDIAQVLTHAKPVQTTIEDAVRNMRVIDAIYDAAGMRRRGQ